MLLTQLSNIRQLRNTEQLSSREIMLNYKHDVPVLLLCLSVDRVILLLRYQYLNYY